MDRRIAVLIDADNVSSKYIKPILDELSKYGSPTYKRIYSDWTRPEMASWKNVLLTYSITPVQQYSYTTGKNSTDSSLIIDAMDILYTGHVDSFCIVSSDSDFTRLAGRLREAGMHVIGMGERKTPHAFISACEVFKYLEVLISDGALVADVKVAPRRTAVQSNARRTATSKAATDETQSSGQSTAKPLDESDGPEFVSGVSSKEEITAILQKIVVDSSDEDGWAFLGNVGNVLNKQKPDFDSRNYGFPKLTQFVNSLDRFDIENRPTNNPGIKHTFVRIKANTRAVKKGRPRKTTTTKAGAGNA